VIDGRHFQSNVAGRATSTPDASDAPGDTGAGRPPILAVLKRAFANFRAHEMTDSAGTLTYFAMMSLFPALLLGVTLLGLFGQQSLISDASEYLLSNGADPQTAAVARSALERVINSSGGALGVALVVSVALAINGASGAFAAAGRALNTVYGVEEDRGFVRRKLVDVGSTLVVIVLFAIVLVAIFLGGQIADDLLGRIGLGSSAAAVWSVARWPAALVAAMVGYGLVYAVAPNVEPRRFRWLTPGAALGVVLWLVLSVAFAVYIRNFSSYGAAYGAFGAAIVLLLWLYVSANAFLFGAEVNAELERAKRSTGASPPAPSPPPTAEAAASGDGDARQAARGRAPSRSARRRAPGRARARRGPSAGAPARGACRRARARSTSREARAPDDRSATAGPASAGRAGARSRPGSARRGGGAARRGRRCRSPRRRSGTDPGGGRRRPRRCRSAGTPRSPGTPPAGGR
jgi:membrane protein